MQSKRGCPCCSLSDACSAKKYCVQGYRSPAKLDITDNRMQTEATTHAVSRKRHLTASGTSDSEEDDDPTPQSSWMEKAGVSPHLWQRSKNHSEIEKRRRDKMNNYITSICSLVPACSGLNQKKLDKITVLKIASQHIRTLKGSISCRKLGQYLPNLTESKEFLLRPYHDRFHLVISADKTFDILFASPQVQKFLNCSPGDMLGCNFFEIVSEEGERLDEIKRQIVYQPGENKDTLIFASGAKRIFTCRFRKLGERGSVEAQCHGYFKSFVTPPDRSTEVKDAGLVDRIALTLVCLVNETGASGSQTLVKEMPVSGSESRTNEYEKREVLNPFTNELESVVCRI